MFLASTFGFYVFFEHGAENYRDNAAEEFTLLKSKVEQFQAGKEKPKEPGTL